MGVMGGSLINSLDANAASTSTTNSTSSTSQPEATGSNPDPSKGGHTANGIIEALLTGDTATKVTAAAQAAVPGGTVQRVENDAEGATYEAHMTKSDGTEVTVKLDSSFKVTATEVGHGTPKQQ